MAGIVCIPVIRPFYNPMEIPVKSWYNRTDIRLWIPEVPLQKPDRKTAGSAQWMRRSAVLICCAFVLVGFLSGCMEELQTSRPAALQPSPPLTMPTPAAQSSTPMLTPQQASDVAGAAPVDLTAMPTESMTAGSTITPTESMTAGPSATLPASAATTVAAAGTPVIDVPGDSGPSDDTVIVPATPPALSNEERWRDRQIDRQVFDSLQMYVTSGSDLWWFDPVNQQHVRLGSFRGEFAAQARFRLPERGEALEVPYQVNQRYGITALSPAVLDRIAAAGYDEWIETYVLLTPNVSPR